MRQRGDGFTATLPLQPLVFGAVLLNPKKRNSRMLMDSVPQFNSARSRRCSSTTIRTCSVTLWHPVFIDLDDHHPKSKEMGLKPQAALLPGIWVPIVLASTPTPCAQLKWRNSPSLLLGLRVYELVAPQPDTITLICSYRVATGLGVFDQSACSFSKEGARLQEWYCKGRHETKQVDCSETAITVLRILRDFCPTEISPRIQARLSNTEW